MTKYSHLDMHTFGLTCLELHGCVLPHGVVIADLFLVLGLCLHSFEVE